MSEYYIEVIMTPHPWDSPNAPYFWVIIKDGCNTGGCGWSDTPENAWRDALEYFKKYMKV